MSNSEISKINIAFVGDITPGGVFTHKGGLSEEVLSYLNNFDLRIGTLESAIGDGSKLCHIKMSDPTLATCIYSPDNMVSMLRKMKIDAVSLANNHSCDCDLEGLYHTIDILDEAGIAHFGAGRSLEEASAPAVLECNGKSICILGYFQEYEYLYRGKGYHPTKDVGGLNIFSIDKAIADIKRYKQLYDYVFVLPHWGMERSMVPLYDEVCFAKKMISAGADGVIGSHAHIVQPAFLYKGSTIAMNLGNFAFPDRYVVPPRLPYYPSPEELNNNIPEVYSFKVVKQLSLKVVAQSERVGAILGMIIDDEEQSYDIKFTRLLKDNTIVFDNLSKSHSNRLKRLTSIASGKFSFLLYVLTLKARMPYIVKGLFQSIGLMKKYK